MVEPQLDWLIDTLIADSEFRNVALFGQKSSPIKRAMDHAVMYDQYGRPYNVKRTDGRIERYTPLSTIHGLTSGDVSEMVWECGHFLHIAHMRLRGHHNLRLLQKEEGSIPKIKKGDPDFKDYEHGAVFDCSVPKVLAALLVASANQHLKNEFFEYGQMNPNSEYPAMLMYVRGLLHFQDGVYASDFRPIFEVVAAQYAQITKPNRMAKV